MIRKLRLSGATVAALLVVELGVRASGIVDFPIYNVDSAIGYIPKSNQSGQFMNMNDWFFNDKSMPIADNWNQNRRPNVVLIGNSIVMGGNTYKQRDKLTPIMQNMLGGQLTVWPIAVGGWTQPNEIVYLNLHPEIASEVDYVAWEYMGGGLTGETQWAGEYVFPTHRPTYATFYVLRRYVLPRLLDYFRASELPLTGPAEINCVKMFDNAVGALAHAIRRPSQSIIWLYPTAAQLDVARRGKEWLPERKQIEEIAFKYGLRVIDIATKPDWDRSLYKGDGIHPNEEGNRVLGAILAKEFSMRIQKRDG